jgi:hypothetical protein
VLGRQITDDAPTVADIRVVAQMVGVTHVMKTGTRSLNACFGLAAAASLAALGWGAAALPAAGDPAGNNGTVKITPRAEDDGIPQNTPHVSCEFDVEWYGFDEGADVLSTVVFTMQAPTADVTLSGAEPAEVFVGGDPAGGGTDLDGEATYRLAFTGEPDPQDGYHVKLTVHTPGTQGSDTKHKVFWVSPCDDSPPPGDDETPPPGA